MRNYTYSGGRSGLERSIEPVEKMIPMKQQREADAAARPVPTTRRR